MSTQHYYFGQGFAGENNIIAHYENYPSENYLYNLYASGWSPIHNQEFHTRTLFTMLMRGITIIL